MNAKRKALTEQLCEPFTDEAGELHEIQDRFSKGNILWTVWKTEETLYLAEFNLINPEWGEQWTSEKKLETDPPKSLTCPIKYLDKTPILNDDWRQRVRGLSSEVKNTRKKIRKMFAEKGDQRLRVVFTPDPGYYLDIPHLDVISSWPVEGRYERNGKRYSVPLKLVSDVYYLPKI
jgi:hypothetical protein